MTRERRPGDWAAWMSTSAGAGAPAGDRTTGLAARVAVARATDTARARDAAAVPDATGALVDAATPVGDAATVDAPRTARREATRQRILDAARDTFAENGVIGGTVEDICERAGFTRGAFYSNFTDKDDVAKALVEREHERLLEHLDLSVAAVDDELSSAPDLESVAGSIVDRILRSIPVDRQLTLMQTELEIFAIRRPDLATSFIEINVRFRQRVGAFIEAVMHRYGRELLVEPAVLTDAVFSIAQGSVRRALLIGPDADVDAMASAVLPGLLLALSRPAEAP